MSKFGWSYPPGCSGPPDDQDYPCEVCGQWEDDCICPPCPECASVGDPRCYEGGSYGHGMIQSPEQKALMVKAEAQWKAEAEAENAMIEEYLQDHPEEN